MSDVTYVRVTSNGTLSTTTVPFDVPDYNKFTPSGERVTGISVRYIGGAGPSWSFDPARKLVMFSPPVPSGVTVQISRHTSLDLQYNFVSGARWSAGNLWADLQQLLRISEEARGLASAGIFGNLDMQGYRIQGLPTPVQGDEPVTIDYLNRWYVDKSNGAAIQELQYLTQNLSNQIAGIQQRLSQAGRGFSVTKSQWDGLVGVVTGHSHDLDDLARIVRNLSLGGGGGGGGSTPNFTYGAGLSDWTWETVTDGVLRLRFKSGTNPNAGFRLLLGNSFQFSEGAFRLNSPNEVVRSADLQPKFNEYSAGITARLSDLSDRVASLEAGGGGGGGGFDTNAAEIDLSGTQLKVDSPSEDEHAVNLRHLETRLKRVVTLIDERIAANTAAIRIETKDRLDALRAGGFTPSPSPQPQPQPLPQPSPGGSSSSAVVFGVSVRNRTVERYSSGTSRPTVGQSPNGTSIFFPFPLNGMWEIRVQSKGGRAVTESFVGSGSSVSSAWGEYTVFTVSGYTGISITVPPSMTATQTYSLSAIFIGQPL